MIPIPNLGAIFGTTTQSISDVVGYSGTLLAFVIALIVGGFVLVAVKRYVLRGVKGVVGGRRGGRRRGRR